MRKFNQYIQQSLSGRYSTSEISLLSHVILEEVSNISITELISSKINNLSDNELRKASAIVERLQSGEPIQYILGKTEFFGLMFRLTADVLIPRPETEELVEWVVGEAPSGKCSILDIGTGSGVIAVTLGKLLTNADIYACDISEAALVVAAENAAAHNVSINFWQCDIFSLSTIDGVGLLPGGRSQSDQKEIRQYEVIVSNPPYISEREKAYMEDNVLLYEPHEALFVPDEEPLRFYMQIADLALLYLKKNGQLFFEINETIGAELSEVLREKGFSEIELRRDISGKERMLKAEI